ncbi:hypothetical protein Pfo_007695 [Paulownia fortunei]|nr:hypothetical protein Pfo_007695 [Paulownia fortunei]
MMGEEEKIIAEMADQPKQNDCSASPSSSTKNTNTAELTSNGSKAKSCKGFLYYSTHFKTDSGNPLCVGLTRSLPDVPQYIVGQSEEEASKEGRSLTDFTYTCLGYSRYKDRKDQASNGQQTQTELPVCIGHQPSEQVLVGWQVKTADSASVPTHIHNKGDGNGLPQRRSPKPANATGEEFLSRLTRNANLVANGVAKNIRKVGNQIKQSLDDILYPYRRPPK